MRSRLSWLAGLVSTAGVLLDPSFAPAAGPMVSVEVGTVLAGDTTKRVDERLAGQGMQARLTRLFHYRSYELVGQEAREVAMGKRTLFDIPGGRSLRVLPRSEPAQGQVEIQVALVEGGRVVMDSALTLGRRGRVVLGGRGHDGGVLLIWIAARVRTDLREADPGALGSGPSAVDNLLPATGVAE